jgi:hypothetical protein
MMPQYSGLAPLKHIRPLGVLDTDGIAKLAGTGFGIQRRGVVLTASHVVASATKPNDIFLGIGDGRLLRAYHIERHPEADLAALLVDSERAPSCFTLGEPPEELGDFPLGTEISSFGFLTATSPMVGKPLSPG